MHARHVTVRIGGTTPPTEHLNQVVSGISAQPGFVHGYWLAPKDGIANAYMFFDTEDNARAGAPETGQRSEDGLIEIVDVEFGAVAAHV